MIKTKKQMFLVIGAFALILLLGTASYAFFNYIRTGGTNAISTGKINFQSSQSANPVNVSNLFPTSAPTVGGISGYNASTADFARVLVTIEGETTYEAGLDYTISAVDVDLTVGDSNDALPLKVHVYEDPTYTHTGVLDNTGDANDDTFSTSFGTAANLSGTKTANKITLASGHIAGDSTWTGGSRYTRHIIIDAYILSTDIAITDTPEESSAWINGRTQYYTSEWNALANSGASFKILVESTETAVSNQNASPAAGTIASCQGCVYFFNDSDNRIGGSVSGIVTQDSNDVSVGTYYNNYNDVLTIVNDGSQYGDDNYRPFFMGAKISGDVITNLYVCSIATNSVTSEVVPFCIEGVPDNDSNLQTIYSSNVTILNNAYGHEADQGRWTDGANSNYYSYTNNSFEYDYSMVWSGNGDLDSSCYFNSRSGIGSCVY